MTTVAHDGAWPGEPGGRPRRADPIIDVVLGMGRLRPTDDVLVVGDAAGLADRLAARCRRVMSTDAIPGDGASADVVVCLPAARGAGRERQVAGLARLLRPGGRLLVAGPMVGLGSTPEDRRAIRASLRRSAGGRLAAVRSRVRTLWRLGMHPEPVHSWLGAFEAAGLSLVHARRAAADLAVVAGTRLPVPARLAG